MPNSTDALLPFPTRAILATKGSPWQDWQVVPANGSKKAKGVSLKSFKPDAKPFSSGNKTADQAAVTALAEELDALQNLFYADGRFKVLVVLQGTDTSGKDGTVRGVFARTSPLGVHTVG